MLILPRRSPIRNISSSRYFQIDRSPFDQRWVCCCIHDSRLAIESANRVDRESSPSAAAKPPIANRLRRGLNPSDIPSAHLGSDAAIQPNGTQGVAIRFHVLLHRFDWCINGWKALQLFLSGPFSSPSLATVESTGSSQLAKGLIFASLIHSRWWSECRLKTMAPANTSIQHLLEKVDFQDRIHLCDLL